MRRLPGMLVVLGVVVFVMGAIRTLFGGGVFGGGVFWVPGETYWRAAVFALLLAIALVMMARDAKGG